MKAKMLKIAGVKTESAFYKKYPTQAAFMKVHGKEFKKAQQGVNMNTQGDTNKNGIPDYLEYTPNQSFGPQNQWKFGNNMSNTSSFGAPTAGQMAGNTFQPSPDPFAMQNYGQQWGQQNPLPQQGTGQISNSVFGENKAVTGGLGGKDYNGKGSGISNQAIASSISSIPEIFNAFASQEKQKESLEQQNKLLGLFETLSQSTDRNAPYQKNILDSPENYAQSTNMFYPSQGTGYDILRGVGRDGATIRKAQDGINNFGPDYDLYSDGGYDSDKVKQYANGGVTGNPIYGAASGVIGSQFNNSAGYQAGAAVAPYADMVLPGSGLALEMLGGGLDQAVGDAGDIKKLTDSNAGIEDRIKKNSMWRNPQYSANMQEGGYMNPEYNPQLITMFGDHDSEDFADYAHKYRSGGHLKEYTPASERAMETYADGGEVTSYNLGETQVESGGSLKPISFNPHNDGTGWTSEIQGQYHSDYNPQLGHSGVIFNHGGNQVEAEKGELLRQVKEGDSIEGGQGELSANITGNLELQPIFGDADPKYKPYYGMKIKNAHKVIADKDKKLNLKQIKIDNEIAQLDPKNKLYKSSLTMMKKGIDDQYKANAEAADYITNHQTKVNDLVDQLSKLNGVEYSHEKFAKKGILSDILAKGEISQAARNGKTIKAQPGVTTSTDDTNYTSKYGITPWKGNVSKGNKYGKATASGFSEKQWDEVADKLGFKGKGNKEFEEFLMSDPRSAPLIKARHQNLYGKDPWIDEEHFGYGWSANQLLSPPASETPPAPVVTKTDEDVESIEETPKKGFPWGATAASLARGLYPAFNMPLGNQINPELYDLANNRVKGFAVNKTYDMLKTPAKYSADKDRNAILSQAREAVKNAGNNPAAQSAIMASVADAMNQVGSKEQEINQQGYQGVYNDNIATVNQNKNRNAALDMDAQLKMLQAESNTDARTLSALTSLYGKEAANKRENIEYNVGMAEHPDFTFGPDGRIIKLPRYIDFDTSGKNATASSSKKQTAPEGFEYLYDSSGNVKTMKSKKEDGVARDGKTIKKKNINGNIVKAFKNL